MERGDLVIVTCFRELQILRRVWQEYPTYVDCCRQEVYDRAIAEGEEPDSMMGYPIEDVQPVDAHTAGLMLEIKVTRYPNNAVVFQLLGNAFQPLELNLPPGAEIVLSDAADIYYGFKYEPGPVVDWRWMLKQYMKLVMRHPSHRRPSQHFEEVFSPTAMELMGEVAKEAGQEERTHGNL